MKQRLDINYNLPKYEWLEKILKTKFGSNLKTIGEIADVICGPFGSAIKNTDYQDLGIPLLRIANISKDGYMIYDDLVYISEELGNSLSRTQVTCGDIVISQRGTLGQCAVVDDVFEKLNISANIIAVKNIRMASADFIRNYILSSIGQALLERNMSGQVQKKVTTQDISNLLIPINCNEHRLSAIVQNAYRYYIQELQQADELLTAFEEKVSKQCALDDHIVKKEYFAIKHKNLDGVIDVKRYAMLSNHHHTLEIRNICDIIDKKINVSNYGTKIIDWIRIDDLPNRPLDIEEVRTQPANEVEGTFFEVQEGDILVARLGPTILNQKIVMVRTLKRTTVASAEFLVLRCKGNYIPEAVMAVLKTTHYRDLMYSQARGSTPSRYRLSREDMLKLAFPDLQENQDQIAIEATKVKEAVQLMRVQAKQEWLSAKEKFEKELLGDLT